LGRSKQINIGTRYKIRYKPEEPGKELSALRCAVTGAKSSDGSGMPSSCRLVGAAMLSFDRSLKSTGEIVSLMGS
jgi:hypothetical protein